MNCKICNANSSRLFTKLILNKYEAVYSKCDNCGFVQVNDPHWLPEAYSSAITSTDIGLVNRNIYLSKEIKLIIDSCFPEAKKMLDYAAGYGMFVRLMRDEGYEFFWQDIYCENLFAKHFELKDAGVSKFDIITAFEVLEHFEHPLPEIEKVLAYSDTAIFSTILKPENDEEFERWWYLSTETGQHIAFYTAKAMQLIAEKYNCNYYNRNSIHVFTKKRLSAQQIDIAFSGKDHKSYLFGLIKIKKDVKGNRISLLENDYNFVKAKINNQKK
jgi:hypothetical protein